jgi:hypothetical protein
MTRLFVAGSADCYRAIIQRWRRGHDPALRMAYAFITLNNRLSYHPSYDFSVFFHKNVAIILVM